MATHRDTRRRPRGPLRPDPRRRGVVLVIVLLALILLVSMVFYILNVGVTLQRKQVAQHAADATATAGAGQVARTFNTVAMNNVGIARLLAAASVIDAGPAATEYTLIDQTALYAAVSDQLSQGVPREELRTELTALQVALAEEVGLLNAAAADFRGDTRIVNATHFRAPGGGGGTMWRAMAAMDAWSQGAMYGLDQTAQLAAMTTGRANLVSDDPAADAALIPMPAIPWQRGTLMDFLDPVNLGQLPPAVDDASDHRGPFDTVFGWRDPVYQGIEGFNGQEGRIVGRGSSGWSGGGSAGAFHFTARDVAGYRTRGTFEVALDRARDRAAEAMPTTQADCYRHHPGGSYVYVPHPIETYLNTLATAKNRFLWNGDPYPSSPSRSTGPHMGDSEAEIIEPDWIVGYPQAVAFVDADPSDPSNPDNADLVRETAYVQTILRIDPFTNEREPFQTTVRRARGWHGHPPGLGPGHAIATFIWLDRVVEEVPNPDADDDPDTDDETLDVVYENYYTFVGINVGESVPVRDPFAGVDPTDATMPGPVDFDHAAMPPETATREGYLTYLGLAQRENKPPYWPARFARSRTSDRMLTVAAAEVFNDHSFDLWTQMWRVRLRPVGDLTPWINALEHSTDAVAALHGRGAPDIDTLNAMQASLESVEPLAPYVLRH